MAVLAFGSRDKVTHRGIWDEMSAVRGGMLMLYVSGESVFGRWKIGFIFDTDTERAYDANAQLIDSSQCLSVT